MGEGLIRTVLPFKNYFLPLCANKLDPTISDPPKRSAPIAMFTISIIPNKFINIIISL